MQEQMGIIEPDLIPHRFDPNRPQHVAPDDSSYKYWHDLPEYSPESPARYHIKRSKWGFWTNFTEDTSRIGNYPAIDLLRCEDGTRVNSPSIWYEKRRPELLELCQSQVWGRIPKEADKLHIDWTVTESEKECSQGAYIEKIIIGKIDISIYPKIKHAPIISGVLMQPKTADGHATPVIIQLNGSIPKQPNKAAIKECFSRGWAYLLMDCQALQPDDGGSMTDYIIGLLNHGNWRKPEDWGDMAAWSWGVGRLIDYCETDKSIDAKHVGVTGHSRYGKTALLCMAYEARTAIAYVSCSGTFGAAPMRSNWGENLEVLVSEQSYHWVCGNIYNYVGPVNEGSYLPRKSSLLKVDAHALLSLAAPRPVFINGGTTDHWANPFGMYTTCRDASPVYNLLGYPGLIMQDRAPRKDVGYIQGNIAYRLHTGGHTDTPDWPSFAKFAERFYPVYRPQADNPLDTTQR